MSVAAPRAALPLAVVLAALSLAAAPRAGAAGAGVRDTRDGVTVDYRDAAGALDPALRTRILDTFFSVYARERADFNPAATDRVAIVIDPGYDGIAYVDDHDGARMTINPAWLHEHPADTDLVTHEAMHIVQAYPEAGDRKPGWLVEGIADYARDRYGVDNAAGGWALPETVKPDQRYDSGYRVTGAFLKWAEAAHPGLVARLDRALRAGRYDPSLWREATGENVDALWARYARMRTAATP